MWWLGTFPKLMVQQQHRVSWVDGVGWGGGPKHYVDTPTRVDVELG